MITLSNKQRDVLIEICNVGMSKAAGQLSTLLSSHINISIPEIKLFNVSKNVNVFSANDVLSYVYQNVSNDLQGRIILIFQRENTSLLTKSVIGNMPKLTEQEVRACEQEAMLEIGNIIISSCISAIVNMLSCQVKLSVPKYNENKSAQFMDSQINDVIEHASDIILLETSLDTESQDISGKLLLILTEDSINKLLSQMAALLGEQ